MYELSFYKKVLSVDLRRIANRQLKIIEGVLNDKLKKDPYLYGKPLRQSLYGFRTLRIGKYRVVYRIEADKIMVFVMAIGKRDQVYAMAQKRRGEI